MTFVYFQKKSLDINGASLYFLDAKKGSKWLSKSNWTLASLDSIDLKGLWDFYLFLKRKKKKAAFKGSLNQKKSLHG